MTTAFMLADRQGAYTRYAHFLGPEPEGFHEVPAQLVPAVDRVGIGRGWGIFDSDGSAAGPLQVQALVYPEEDERYEGDGEVDDSVAWMEFLASVAAGDADCVAAYHALLIANPLEIDCMLTWQASHQLPAETTPRLFTSADGMGLAYHRDLAASQVRDYTAAAANLREMAADPNPRITDAGRADLIRNAESFEADAIRWQAEADRLAQYEGDAP